LAAAGVLVHLRLTLDAIVIMHGPSAAGGWLALVWWGFWGGAWVVFLLRWYGRSKS
jgi:hypothetical protein